MEKHRTAPRMFAAIAALAVFAAPAAQAARVTSGLVAYYPFSEGSGSAVYDRSPTAPHTDLHFEGSAGWLGGTNGVNLSGGRLGSNEAAKALIDALQATNQATFEAWVLPANLSQTGPARILDISNGPNAGEYDYALGQIQNDVEGRLRHTGKNASLQPRLVTSDHFLTTNLVHLVHVFDGSQERLYVDGVQHPTTVNDAGNLSNWDDARVLSLGNTPTLERIWSGDMRTVAIYDRALTPAEIAQNHGEGANVPLSSAIPITVEAGNDHTTPSIPGGALLTAVLRGEIVDPDAAGPIASTWTQISGPVPTFIDDASAPETTVSLPLPGTYVFELAAGDEVRTSADRVTIVAPASTGSASVNLYPDDLDTGVPILPTLEIGCPATAPVRGQYLVATDDLFADVVYDSGEDANAMCSLVVLEGLAPGTQHYWSGRQQDGGGVWSAWSAPTSFTTGGALTTVSFQDGVDGYDGTRDVDIRGSFQNPQVSLNEWDQGAQDILRSGRRPPGEEDEIYRSMVSFDLSGVDPADVESAYLELTIWMHGSPNVFHHGPTAFYALLTPFGEGDDLFGEFPEAGETSWTYSQYAQPWSVPGAADPGVDRTVLPVMRTRITNELGVKAVISGEAFVDLVRDWAQNPGTNYGVVFQAEDEANQPPLKIASREHPDPAFRPRLVILPEPGFAFSLGCGLALLALLRRRSR